MDIVVQEFTSLIHTEIELEAFSLSSIDKLVDFQVTLDELKMILDKYKMLHVSIEDSIT